MKGFLIYFGLLYNAQYCLAFQYFHEPSHVEVIAPTLPKDRISNFGYSIGYQSTTSRLFVGAPHSDIDGKVFSCPVNNDDLKKKTILCEDLGIDVSKLTMDYSRINSTEQNFCLGASIAVTADYIFTCAPLWTTIFLDGKDERFGPLGTCFLSNGTEYASRYFGLTEEYLNQSIVVKPHIYDVLGGIGWSTLADPDNNVIIIAMSQIIGSSFSYIKIDKPLEPAKSILSTFRSNLFTNYYYLGLSMTSGVFFSNYSTIYAFSMMESTTLNGEIAFFYYDKEEGDMTLLKYKKNVVKIKDDKINSIFGAVLHSANLNSDSYDELIVGAPAQIYSNGYDNGAVHFYLGGRTAEIPEDYIATLMIYGTKSMARFGSAIASVDLDNDFIPEIFISAPYEETGVVYILAGYEIKQYLNREGYSEIPITSFKITQRIINSKSRAMGISLQPVVNEFGNALAIGSLYNDKVLLYRHIPSINVTVQASLKGKNVRELDRMFTMTITVIVEYPPKPEFITGKLFLTANIKGEDARIKNNGNITFELNKSKTKYSTDVDVSLEDIQPGTYIFNVKINDDVDNLNRPDFDESLYTINTFYGNLEHNESVFRRCKDEECVPELSVHFLGWTGGDNEYILGSTVQENMTVVVHNSRNETYRSCARVKITGAQFSIPACAPSNSEWHTCRILKIGRNEEFPIHVYFNMSQSTNRDKNLVVDVMLYNICGTEIEKADGKNSTSIPFNMTTTNVFIDGLGYDRNVTQSEIDDVNTPYIEIRNTFTATNKGNFKWTSIPAVINIKKEPFIEDADISQSAFDCAKQNGGALDITFTCNITVVSNSTTAIQTTVTIIKKKMMNNFKQSKLSVTSSYKLHLEPTNEILEKSFATTVYLREDSGIGNNQNLVIFISVLVAIIILAISTFIMYKGGFFKSKESQQLDELKEEIRKKSIRRPPENSDEDEMNVELGDENQIELEVLEDGISLQETNVANFCDSEQLIEKDEKC